MSLRYERIIFEQGMGQPTTNRRQSPGNLAHPQRSRFTGHMFRDSTSLATADNRSILTGGGLLQEDLKIETELTDNRFSQSAGNNRQPHAANWKDWNYRNRIANRNRAGMRALDRR